MRVSRYAPQACQPAVALGDLRVAVVPQRDGQRVDAPVALRPAERERQHVPGDLFAADRRDRRHPQPVVPTTHGLAKRDRRRLVVHVPPIALALALDGKVDGVIARRLQVAVLGFVGGEAHARAARRDHCVIFRGAVLHHEAGHERDPVAGDDRAQVGESVVEVHIMPPKCAHDAPERPRLAHDVPTAKLRRRDEEDATRRWHAYEPCVSVHAECHAPFAKFEREVARVGRAEPDLGVVRRRRCATGKPKALANEPPLGALGEEARHGDVAAPVLTIVRENGREHVGIVEYRVVSADASFGDGLLSLLTYDEHGVLWSHHSHVLGHNCKVPLRDAE